MNRTSLIFVLLSLFSGVACSMQANGASTHQSFQADTAQHVVVKLFAGNINVTVGAKDVVDVDMTTYDALYLGDPRPKKIVKDNINITMERVEGTLFVTARLKDDSDVEGVSCCNRPDLVLQVPADAILDLRTDNGDVNVQGVMGVVATDVPHGEVKVDENTSGSPACTADDDAEQPRTETTGRTSTPGGTTQAL